jgi:alpha-L-fucosidase
VPPEEPSSAVPEGFNAESEWFVHDRFGLFIHWGIYAAAARHEWVRHRERLTEEQYRRYFDHFDPDLFDPQAWASLARRAGMRYMVVTSKHHDGFCLWDSALTDYKAPNTPARRDLLRPLLDAFRAEGLRVGLYHSLIDWHHPDFPVDGLHPQRDDLAFRERERHRDMRRYVAYLHGQVRELLTGYGRIDYMWFDFSYPGQDWGWSKGKGREDWQSEELEALVRRLQPHILLNDRLDLGRGIRTPEQVQPRRSQPGTYQLWEACQTMNGSWGYDRDNLDWKPADLLLRMLIDGVAKGGNLLLNVGPTARGEIDPRSQERLLAIGDWLRRHGRAIYGCGESAFSPPEDCRYTQRGDRLYLHLFSWPFRHLHLDGLAGRVAYAQFLHDASEVRWHERADKGGLTVELPVQRPDVLVPVVELFLR